MGTDEHVGDRPARRCACAASQGLRVVDASVFPYVTNGNIYAPVMMTAEKSADLILGNTPLAPEPVEFYRHGQEAKATALASTRTYLEAVVEHEHVRGLADREPAELRHAGEPRRNRRRGGRVRARAGRRARQVRDGVAQRQRAAGEHSVGAAHDSVARRQA